jgi:hypothetical protein
MRDRHPSISFLQYKLTHFHDPKAAAATAASKPAAAATAASSKPAAARLYRCRLCPLAVTEAQIKSHLVRAHHAALLRQQEALNDDNDDDDDEIQVLEVIQKPSDQPVVATTKNPLRRPHHDSQMKRGSTNGDLSPPSQRQRGEEDSGDSKGEDSGDGTEEEEAVPRSKRHRPARMFYHEPYNFFRDETGDDPDYVSVPKVGGPGKLRTVPFTYFFFAIAICLTKYDKKRNFSKCDSTSLKFFQVASWAKYSFSGNWGES